MLSFQLTHCISKRNHSLGTQAARFSAMNQGSMLFAMSLSQMMSVLVMPSRISCPTMAHPNTQLWMVHQSKLEDTQSSKSFSKTIKSKAKSPHPVGLIRTQRKMPQEKSRDVGAKCSPNCPFQTDQPISESSAFVRLAI